ncbi:MULTISPECIES: histidinol-phosphate transaminase [unclassified Methanoregula]|uniref:pyridoxal phosphate-dependent aminotransferase n=1 Tax=unclassified Methanoregula TaxID=2649730 RepID=UPI0009CD783A|nr:MULTISPECIES: histidinol-phosphate transaminase [unclassified Methanoregula]OPX63897.1 MAG: threonine-phosphate decarboxylase [Methanoregula sp. PtaB.Bin085]OPY35450.1 MAG: threonine-phosphate decarboxylase [Methanoregula sp. PtaU1.Bin006]
MAVGFPKKVIHGGTGKLQREKTQKNVLDFSASVNPFPPEIDWHCDTADLSAYPDDNYSALKERIGSVFSRDPEEICVGNGSIEIIRVFCSVALGRTKGSRFFTDTPTFGEYELSASLAGARRTEKPEKTTVRFVCNPNNPTGTLQRRAELLELLTATKQQDGILFCDEAFIALADDAESLADVRDPNLFVLHSLTKSFAVPGIRFGFGFGDRDLVEKIETARSPWCVNAYAEAFAMEALLHLEDLAGSRRKIEQERQRLTSGMTGLGLSCTASSANFILADYGRDVAPLCEKLAHKNILVRDCTSFGLPTCIRIAVRKPEENTQLLEVLGSCVR